MNEVEIKMTLREACRAVQNSVTVGQLLGPTWQNSLLNIGVLHFCDKDFKGIINEVRHSTPDQVVDMIF